ncbi:bifunctional hydroxymethylpyrimidine kinase/phosphomethylpyrimidine kinase [Granulicoccus phenolivorans]|uniref:bifunctional hydroxymethylpyrimidine kinase/phosphomethylpyrimidine kinase n=1 Tax=Granulicoccus phenolivorans TaxID=266854 RepID=UPI0003FAF213|nr:bifunctional hydroxymethylpyrimidine kinase/phosphomethylpyrimidine kinase [Granulicoccus phenolivorans]
MRPPVALTIAGSDPSGGAGIQADLKSFSALGAYGTTVITALTAQNTRGVTGVRPVPADFVREQFETLIADVRIDAIKIGMLGTAELARCVAELLRSVPGVPVVLDPVMVATSGDRLLDADAVAAVRELLPLAEVITPNLPEAAVLLGTEPASDRAGMAAQARALAALGTTALVKGGHAPGGVGLSGQAVDVYADAAGVTEFTAPVVRTQNTHGTGCSLSSAIAALRPQRPDWRTAIADAKAWLTGALAAADRLEVGHGHGPVHHFHQLWPADPSGSHA